MDCTNKRIAFTGIAAGFTRPEIHQAIAAAGGILVNSVSRTTDLLIAGESGVTGSKRENAKTFGTPIITAGDFMRTQHAVGADWPFGPTRKAGKKAKPLVQRKEVKQAFVDLRRNGGMKGFVGV